MPKINILIVCTGNTCRSVMAGRYLAAKAGPKARVETRGLRPGPAVPPEVFDALAPAGIAPFEHTPRQLTAQDIERAALVFVMEASHQTELEKLFPAAQGKTKLLAGNTEIPDPCGKGQPAYNAAFASIKTAADGIVEKLLSGRKTL